MHKMGEEVQKEEQDAQFEPGWKMLLGNSAFQKIKAVCFDYKTDQTTHCIASKCMYQEKAKGHLMNQMKTYYSFFCTYSDDIS